MIQKYTLVFFRDLKLKDKVRPYEIDICDLEEKEQLLKSEICELDMELGDLEQKVEDLELDRQDLSMVLDKSSNAEDEDEVCC